MPTTPVLWDDSFTANTTLTGVQDEVRTFQLANGNFWVVWHDFDATPPANTIGPDILGQLYDVMGNPIGGPVRLNQGFTNGTEGDAEFAADLNSDGFYMVYETSYTSPAGPFQEIVIERHAADGSMINGGLVVTDPTGDGSGIDVLNPDIAIASGANGMIVWERTNDAGDTDIMGRTFNADGLSFGSVFTIKSDADDNYDAEIVALTNGNYAVVWTDEFNGSAVDTDIRGAIYNQSGTLISNFSAGTTLGTENESSIAALSTGGFVISYSNATTGDVLAYVYNASGAIQGASILVAGGPAIQGKSTVAATNDGGFVVTWVESSEVDGKTFMQAYTGAGAKVGEVVTLSPNPAAAPVSLIMLADGRVLAGYEVTTVGDALAAIYDPRDNANGTAVYTPVSYAIGTPDSDTFTAADDASEVHGWGGNDIINDGVGINANIYGDEGNDSIIMIGIASAESAHGGAGEDVLAFTSIAGDAVVDLQAGTAIAEGQVMIATGFEHFTSVLPGVDIQIFGTDGFNAFATGVGDDWLDGRGGADQMQGGSGNDTYVVDNAGDIVTELDGGGVDTVRSSVTRALEQYTENLTLTGSANINGIGNAFDNLIIGNSGNNKLNGLAGSDEMRGGAGNDYYIVDDVGDMVIEDDGEGLDRVDASVSYSLVGQYIETLVLIGNAAINGTGNSLVNTIVGNSAANILDGGEGADTMRGGAGEDVYHVDNSGDKVLEKDGEGSDLVYSSVTYSLAGQFIEVLVLTGDAVIGGTGNGLNNRLEGNDAVNVLYGMDGNDRLDGKGGADTMRGGLGNDTFVVDNAGDVIQENAGEGNDTVEASIGYSLVGQFVETLVLTGNADINGTGNGQANTLIGNDGDNILDGKGGADSLRGGLGNDTLIVDNVNDKIVELDGEGYDTVLSSVTFSLAGQFAEMLELTGSANINGTGNGIDNTLVGNSGANVLSGGGGNDAIAGGLGNDTLNGGAGMDSFFFHTALGANNVDTIQGFSVADDTILLSKEIFGAAGADGMLNANAFRLGSAALDADDRILYDAATGNIWYDADGNGGGAAVLFAKVAAGTALTNMDFEVYGTV